MTELYKATFAYDTDKEDELSLKAGETIRVSNKDNADWWIAERIDNKNEFGLVPSNFLEKIPVSEGMVLAIVTKDYLAQSSEELSLQKNRIVTVLDRDIAEGWWKGDLNGKIGVFPANHVDLVEESETPNEDDSKSKKDAFKLAAYGVKQGGIGSILAGGFSLKRSSTASARSSVNERPTSTSSNPAENPTAPLIPNKPRPSVSKPIEPPTINTSLNNPKSINTTASSRAMVLHDYNPESEDEIKLMRGEYVTVIDQMDNDGWWKGISENGSTGVFPSNFVQILAEEKPPQRPARTRPATVVKTEPSASANSPENMARPPPVPVTTRPTSLLSNRGGSENKDSNSSSSVGSPPPRPITTPPRPTATPPVPTTRRANSIMTSPPPPVDVGHRRIPSIPLMSPDLPPMSPVHDRPTRPIPRPTSTTSSDSFGGVPPVNVNRSLSPDQNALNHMAKPPKVNFGNKNPVIPPRAPSIPGSAPSSRPTSTNGEVLPPVPKRSMPPLPETSVVPNNFDQAPPPPTTVRSPERKPHSNTALPSTPVDAAAIEDPLDVKIRQLIKQETEKIRKEFEDRLEDERIERLRLQVEFDELKTSLN